MGTKKSIKTNIVLNCIKTAMSVLFPLITFPYISRVLGTLGLGKINFGNSIISYFTLIAALGVTTYSIREGAAIRDKKTERDKFFNEVFTINFISMIVAYIALCITVIISAKLHNYILLLAVQSLVLLFNWIGVDWIFNIYEDYKYINIRAFCVQLASLVLMFLFVKKPEDYIIYACITVFASGGSYILNYIYAKKYYRPRLTIHCKFKTHILPMLVLAANLIAVTVYVNADTTMLGYMLGEHEVGLYSTAVKVYTIIKHIMSAVITSATARISFYYLNNRNTEYCQLMTKMGSGLLLISIPAMAGMFMISDDIITLLAGYEYAESAPVLRILSFALVFATFASYYSTYGLIVARKEKIVLLFTVISAIINVGLNFILIPAIGIQGAAITTLISEFVVFVAFAKLANAGVFRSISRTLESALIASAWIVFICYLLKSVDQFVLRLFLSILLSIVGYGLILLLRKESLVTGEIEKVKHRIKVGRNRSK